jgi:hypothetical protein
MTTQSRASAETDAADAEVIQRSRHEPLSYRSLGSLPAQPGALVKRLAEIPAESA